MNLTQCQINKAYVEYTCTNFKKYLLISLHDVLEPVILLHITIVKPGSTWITIIQTYHLCIILPVVHSYQDFHVFDNCPYLYTETLCHKASYK